jgi:hypothetical protein
MKEMRVRKEVKDRRWQNFFIVLAKGQRELVRKGSLRA